MFACKCTTAIFKASLLPPGQPAPLHLLKTHSLETDVVVDSVIPVQVRQEDGEFEGSIARSRPGLKEKTKTQNKTATKMYSQAAAWTLEEEAG